jgi:hypothetical protein
VGQLLRRELTKFVVNQGQELTAGLGITGCRCVKELGDVGHIPKVSGGDSTCKKYSIWSWPTRGEQGATWIHRLMLRFRVRQEEAKRCDRFRQRTNPGRDCLRSWVYRSRADWI